MKYVYFLLRSLADLFVNVKDMIGYFVKRSFMLSHRLFFYVLAVYIATPFNILYKLEIRYVGKNELTCHIN